MPTRFGPCTLCSLAPCLLASPQASLPPLVCHAIPDRRRVSKQQEHAPCPFHTLPCYPPPDCLTPNDTALDTPRVPNQPSAHVTGAFLKPTLVHPPACSPGRSGSPPFKAASEYLTFQKVIDRDFSYPGDYPPAARDLTEKLLAAEPSARIGGSRERGLELAASRMRVTG